MALPPTGTATRDGSCCCGGGGECCEYGDPSDTLCVEVSGIGGDCGDLNGSYTATLSAPCGWSVTVDELTGWGYSVNIGATIEVTGGRVFDEPACGFGTGEQPVNTAPGCLPVTVSGAWEQRASGVVVDSGTCTVTVSDGPCGGSLMAATASGASAAPEPPCRWRGAELTGPERAALALDHRKTWFRCGKPGFPRLGLPVTDCRTCKAADMRCSRAGCAGYEPADVDGRPDV